MKHLKEVILRNRCPKCKSINIRSSFLREELRVLSDLLFQPYRCRSCRTRFWGIHRYVRLFMKTAAMAGTLVIIMSVAVILLSRLDDNQVTASPNDEAISRHLQLAAQGDPVAQLKVGLMYLEGKSKAKDYRTARHWLELAARQGQPDAQYHLGASYMVSSDFDSRRDMPEAARWLKKAAQNGQVDAQYRLGILYEQGIGVIQDFEEEARWIRMAADQGMISAMYQMGILHENGRGVPTDNIQAYVWYNLAAAGGEEKAVDHRAVVARDMTRDEVSEAQRRSRIWKPSAAKDLSAIIDTTH